MTVRLAILGGTFNPPHNGHIALAKYVLCETDYDTVVLIPTSIPAHKPGDAHITPAQRLAMVELCTRELDGVFFDSCDIDRGGVSYSIDTVSDVLERYGPEGRPGFIVGDDLLAGFSSWKSVDTFVAGVDLMVAHRTVTEKLPFSYPHRYLDNACIPVTSHDIRRRAGTGMPIGMLVPPAVAEYIHVHGLYHSRETK